jgi:hypothetical protein
MKSTYLNTLTSSFYLWLDHEILYRGEAFQNFSGKIYNSPDPTFSQNTIYGAPFKQWVLDTSIPNAVIASGFYSNGTFLPRGTSGAAIDFNRGRIIFNKNVPSNLQNLSAAYAFKEYNLYYTDEKEENLLFEKRYDPMPKVTRVTGALAWNDDPYPCIFFKNTSIENKPFAFGGEDNTMSSMRCIILAENIYSLDGAISIMVDSARKTFPLLSNDKLPYNIYGDLKSGISNYNYYDLCTGLNDRVYIDRVTVSRMSETENKKMNSKVVAAIVDFELSDVRNPRLN